MCLSYREMAVYRAFTKRSKGRKEPTLGVHFSVVPLREMIGTVSNDFR